jgi:hypothetical protein
MNGCIDLLGAQIQVVYLGPACSAPKEAPMIEILFKLAKFTSRRENVYITINRA